MDGSDDATAIGSQDDGQAIGRLDGEAGGSRPAARIDDDAVGPNGPPLPRRRGFKARQRAR